MFPTFQPYRRRCHCNTSTTVPQAFNWSLFTVDTVVVQQRLLREARGSWLFGGDWRQYQCIPTAPSEIFTNGPTAKPITGTSSAHVDPNETHLRAELGTLIYSSTNSNSLESSREKTNQAITQSSNARNWNTPSGAHKPGSLIPRGPRR